MDAEVLAGFLEKIDELQQLEAQQLALLAEGTLLNCAGTDDFVQNKNNTRRQERLTQR